MKVNINKEYLVKTKDDQFVNLSHLELECTDLDYQIGRDTGTIRVSIRPSAKEAYNLPFSEYHVPYKFIWY